MVRVRGLKQVNLPNRSSKHLLSLCKRKPGIWSMSNEALKAHSSEIGSAGNIYDAELLRRKKKAEKRKTPRPAAKKMA